MASRAPSPSRRCLHAFASRTWQVAQLAGQIACGIAYRFVSRKFIFTVAAVSSLSSKIIHISAYLPALSSSDLQWGPSFFAQDTMFLILIRFLLDYDIFAGKSWPGTIATAIALLNTLCVLALAAIGISFFAVAGSELHWRNAALASDASSWKLLLTGLFSFALVVAAIVVISWVLQDIFYFIAGIALNLVKWPFSVVLRRFAVVRNRQPLSAKYAHIPQQDLEGASELLSKEEEDLISIVDEAPRKSMLMVAMSCVVGFGMLLQVVLYLARPHESSLTFMSWTLSLLPFADLARASPALVNLSPLYGTVDRLGYKTALADPIHYPWLPQDKPLEGFEDWYEADKKHYLASEDPLKISNLAEQVLPRLKESLKSANIRHVVLIKLESTRKDVFPFKKDGFIWKQLVDSFENKSLPDAAMQRLSTLSPTANFLTGDYNDGFEHKTRKRRGGINFNQAHTSATYTLKSLTGTLCGLSPLVADFNAEVSHHIYQPCLPHILEAFNQNLNKSRENAAGDDFTSYKWKTWFMQSVTNGFDKQDELMLKWGFPANTSIHKEYLKSQDAKFGVVDAADVNYYGMAEDTIEDYVRDAFKMAKEKNERVFLTHLTSTAHHPFGLPEDVKAVQLAEEGKLEDLSGYLNAVGFVDRWLQKVLDILDEQGVADETLVVLAGDHGLSVAENDGVTPYYNPNIGNFHVPLVFSHPKLPAIDINSAVVSYQILPTILDMLMQTDSLSPSQSKVAHDLVRNYEGQSLIRPLINFNNKTGQANWQFTVMNPGRATIAVRDGRHPNWRLTAPVVENTEWRFTDLKVDAHEENALVSFGFRSLLRKIERTHSLEAAKWAEEAAFIARWWVEENSRRWRFDP